MDEAGRAYLSGLKLLARRELSEAQLRARLARRRFDPEHIDGAIARLREERALDDRRAALACARTEAQLRHRGRARVIRHLESLGIAREIARAAAAEVFGQLDESALLERALERQLRRGGTLADARTARRVFRHLVAQGFEPDRVSAMLRSRTRDQEPRTD